MQHPQVTKDLPTCMVKGQVKTCVCGLRCRAMLSAFMHDGAERGRGHKQLPSKL